MSWQVRGPYRGYNIWVMQQQRKRNRKWVASVEVLPEVGVMATAGPGKEGVPGEFDSEDDAKDAAKRYIEKRQQQRGTQVQ